MIAEEYQNSYQPNSSISKGSTVKLIIKSFIETTPIFKAHIKTFTVKTLNEEEQTQEFVNIMRRKTQYYPFLIGQEKKDLYHGAKGKPDFYFYSREESESTESLFDVEAKRLPSPPPKSREKEYVIGDKSNGGIERFKNEKHGKGLSECGMLGFIETEDSNFWLAKINEWLEELSKSNENWVKDETLKEIKNKIVYTYLNSIVHTISKRDLKLHHFWIK
ncbi:hypothetical protein HY745_02395 [Candidatus Desantisbacteria bacterium]|nr:hypothetical protein [Candidatus Desantisbacteria bacterium]